MLEDPGWSLEGGVIFCYLYFGASNPSIVFHMSYSIIKNKLLKIRHFDLKRKMNPPQWTKWANQFCLFSQEGKVAQWWSTSPRNQEDVGSKHAQIDEFCLTWRIKGWFFLLSKIFWGLNGFWQVIFHYKKHNFEDKRYRIKLLTKFLMKAW